MRFLLCRIEDIVCNSETYMSCMYFYYQKVIFLSQSTRRIQPDRTQTKKVRIIIIIIIYSKLLNL